MNKHTTLCVAIVCLTALIVVAMVVTKSAEPLCLLGLLVLLLFA